MCLNSWDNFDGYRRRQLRLQSSVCFSRVLAFQFHLVVRSPNKSEVRHANEMLQRLSIPKHLSHTQEHQTKKQQHSKCYRFPLLPLFVRSDSFSFADAEASACPVSLICANSFVLLSNCSLHTLHICKHQSEKKVI